MNGVKPCGNNVESLWTQKACGKAFGCPDFIF